MLGAQIWDRPKRRRAALAPEPELFLFGDSLLEGLMASAEWDALQLPPSAVGCPPWLYATVR
jgi:hypothetical protein